MIDEQLVKLAVRWLHVIAMAVLVGGSLLVCTLVLRRDSGKPPNYRQARVFAIETYEWAFWGALAVLVMTGIGNLGAYGAVLPGPATTWGGKLVAKLALVLLLMLFSVVRAVTVSRLIALDAPGDSLAWRIVTGMYAATALLALVILALAVALSHGG